MFPSGQSLTCLHRATPAKEFWLNCIHPFSVFISSPPFCLPMFLFIPRSLSVSHSVFPTTPQPCIRKKREEPSRSAIGSVGIKSGKSVGLPDISADLGLKLRKGEGRSPLGFAPRDNDCVVTPLAPAPSVPHWVRVAQGSLPVLKFPGSWKQRAQGELEALSLGREHFFH